MWKYQITDPNGKTYTLTLDELNIMITNAGNGYENTWMHIVTMVWVDG